MTFSGPIQKLYDWNDKNGPAVDISCEFKSIEIVSRFVTVCLKSKNWTWRQFYRFFTFLKANENWKNINKVFHLHT